MRKNIMLKVMSQGIEDDQDESRKCLNNDQCGEEPRNKKNTMV